MTPQWTAKDERRFRLLVALKATEQATPTQCRTLSRLQNKRRKLGPGAEAAKMEEALFRGREEKANRLMAKLDALLSNPSTT